MTESVKLSKSQLELLTKNGQINGYNASAMIGRWLEDEFGGLEIDAHSGLSVEAIRSHVQVLESILKSR
jgi:hypothetical protein